MTSKQLKFLQLFADMCRQQPQWDAKVLSKHFKGLLELDFALALDAWDYLCATFEPELSDKKTAHLYGETVLTLFYAKAPIKCVKAILDTPSIRRAVFQYNPKAGTGDSFNILTELLSANKTSEAEDLFKCLIKNTHIEFGQICKEALERLFVEILKKSATKKIEMSKKLSTLLLTYIAKIKTDERSMLEQRIRETL